MARRRCHHCTARLGWLASLLRYRACGECAFRMERGGSPLRPPTAAACACCAGKGEHPCGSECDACDGSGVWPDMPPCRPKHGPDCTCEPAPNLPTDGAAPTA